MDRVSLVGMRVFTHVGCSSEERKVGQHLEVDLVIEGDFRAAGVGDDLGRAVDYAEAYARVSDALRGLEAKLLETAAERAAEAVLAMPRVEAVTVRVRKEAPPIPHGHARYAEVEVRRSRAPSRVEGKSF